MEINAENMLFDRLNALVKASSDKKIIIRNVLGQRYIASGAENKEILIYGVAGNALGCVPQQHLGQGLRKRTGRRGRHHEFRFYYRIRARGRHHRLRHARRHYYGGGRRGVPCGHPHEGIRQSRPENHNRRQSGRLSGRISGGRHYSCAWNRIRKRLPGRRVLRDGQYGGKIYIRTRSMPRDLPPQVDVKTNADKSEILPLIKEYCSCFGADFNSLSKDEYMLLTPSTSNIYKRLYCNRSM